jgi:hypothetical protein
MRSRDDGSLKQRWRNTPFPQQPDVPLTAGGGEYKVGRITLWDPPAELAFQWHPASFSHQQATEVYLRFEPVGAETRVVAEHTGWDAIAQKHVARHGFRLEAFLECEAEWWQALRRSRG